VLWLRRSKRHALTGRFNYLLISLLLILGAYPYVQGREHMREAVLQLLISGAFLSAVYAMSDHQRRFMTAIILGMPGILLSIKNFFHPTEFTTNLENIILLPFYIYTIIVIVKSVLTARQVTNEILVGAACVYLLMGITWGDAYTYLEKVRPHSFNIDESVELTGDIRWSYFMYFSFSTLTTLGYGDVTPRTPQARSLTSLEASAGVLYVAILISRLVALYTMEVRSRKEDF
jgi:voltage-gated potassium channel